MSLRRQRRLKIVVNIFFGRTVRINKAFVVDPGHRFVAQGRRKIDEILVCPTAYERAVFDHRQIMLKVKLLVFDAEIERFGH